MALLEFNLPNMVSTVDQCSPLLNHEREWSKLHWTRNRCTINIPKQVLSPRRWQKNRRKVIVKDKEIGFHTEAKCIRLPSEKSHPDIWNEARTVEIHISLEGPPRLPESHFNVFKYRNLIILLSERGIESQRKRDAIVGIGRCTGGAPQNVLQRL